MYKLTRQSKYFFGSKPNPFQNTFKSLNVDGKKYQYYSLPALNDKRLEKIPYSIRVLLESALRNCDEFNVLKKDVLNILDWEK